MIVVVVLFEIFLASRLGTVTTTDGKVYILDTQKGVTTPRKRFYHCGNTADLGLARTSITKGRLKEVAEPSTP